jgi:chromosome segregation ATPase
MSKGFLDLDVLRSITLKGKKERELKAEAEKKEAKEKERQNQLKEAEEKIDKFEEEIFRLARHGQEKMKIASVDLGSAFDEKEPLNGFGLVEKTVYNHFKEKGFEIEFEGKHDFELDHGDMYWCNVFIKW